MTACHNKCLAIVLVAVFVWGVVYGDRRDGSDDSVESAASTDERIIDAKMDLWSRGAFAFEEYDLIGFQRQGDMAPLRLGPVRSVRRDSLREYHQQKRNNNNNYQKSPWWNTWRGGGSVAEEESKVRIQELAEKFGPDFVQAIEQTKVDHAEDCRKSCELFYCAPQGEPALSIDILLQNGTTRIASYSMGAVPPEDFATEFG